MILRYQPFIPACLHYRDVCGAISTQLAVPGLFSASCRCPFAQGCFVPLGMACRLCAPLPAVQSILPLFRRKLKMKLMAFILKLVVTPGIPGQLHLLMERIGIPSVGISLTSSPLCIGYRGLSRLYLDALSHCYCQRVCRTQEKFFRVLFALLCVRGHEMLTRDHSVVSPSVQWTCWSVLCPGEWTHSCVNGCVFAVKEDSNSLIDALIFSFTCKSVLFFFSFQKYIYLHK